jgi:[ribosomal protein S5]-alanine N-acetyltransferase
MKEPTFLHDDKVILRSFAKDDIPIWASWFNDYEVTKYMNKGMFPNSLSGQKEYLEKLHLDKSTIQLAVINKENGVLAGIVALHKLNHIHRTGDISILIGDRKELRKSLATHSVGLLVRHAFYKLNLNKLTAGMWSNNEGSEKCFIKNGFVLEGRKIQQYNYKMEYIDELNYGLLRSNWRKTLKNDE